MGFLNSMLGGLGGLLGGGGSSGGGNVSMSSANLTNTNMIDISVGSSGSGINSTYLIVGGIAISAIIATVLIIKR